MLTKTIKMFELPLAKWEKKTTALELININEIPAATTCSRRPGPGTRWWPLALIRPWPWTRPLSERDQKKNILLDENEEQRHLWADTMVMRYMLKLPYKFTNILKRKKKCIADKLCHKQMLSKIYLFSLRYTHVEFWQLVNIQSLDYPCIWDW